MVQSTMMDNEQLVISIIFERAAKYYPNREILSQRPDKSMHKHTFADFSKRTMQLAEALSKAGIKKGDTVGTLMWNHYAHLEAYYAVPLAGGVIHTLNLRLHPDEIAYLVNHAGNKVIIVDDTLFPLFAQFAEKINVEKVIYVNQTGQPMPAGVEDYEAFLERASGDWRIPELDEKDPAGMCYTSGTTGKPKGVVYSHRAIVLHTMMLGAGMIDGSEGIRHTDTVLPVVPMFHANAWGIPHIGIMSGSKLIFPGPHMDPASLLDLIVQHNVNCAVGVPTIWMGFLKAMDEHPDRWAFPKGFRTLVGGSAAPRSMIEAFERKGATVFHGWGMTETTPLGSMCCLKENMRDYSPEKKWDIKAKQGLAVPMVSSRIVNDQGEAPWDGKTIGELQVKGPWVAASYYNPDEDCSEKWTEDGWFRTGDVASIDPEGYIKISDRTKDLIKSGGEWISSIDLENAIMAHPAIQEACVIGLPHPKWAERPLAVVVTKPGQTVELEELRTFLAPDFAKFWLPDGLEHMEEIPRTSAGKFLKSEVREKFRDRPWS